MLICTVLLGRTCTGLQSGNLLSNNSDTRALFYHMGNHMLLIKLKNYFNVQKITFLIRLSAYIR